MCGLINKRKRNKGTYDSVIELLEKNNITSLRKNTKILVVDDEDDDIYQVLKERQYDVYYKSDMTNPIEAEPFDIMMIDIKGVAKRIRSSMEGFALACEIKSKYPLKRVCCYSGSVHEEISEQLADKKIDAFFIKDMDLDKICDKIDNMILDYVNIEKQWEVLRDEMVKNRVSDPDIQKIRKIYFNSFSSGNFIELNDIIMTTLKNSTVMLNITSSILTLIKVLAV